MSGLLSISLNENLNERLEKSDICLIHVVPLLKNMMNLPHLFKKLYIKYGFLQFV